MSRTSTVSLSLRKRSGDLPSGGVPTSAVDVERTLDAIGVRPSRRLGQSFLFDPFVADAEAALLHAAPAAPVVEVGGGLGVLTAALLRKGVDPLTVLERDPRLVRFLRRQFGSRAKVIEADALTFAFPPGAAVIGNLPFSIATPLLIRLWAARIPRIVVMVQREVAERICASPGRKAYGRLSIVAQLYGSAELFQPVPSHRFWPEPEVEGRILVHEARNGPLPVPSVASFEEIVGVVFSARRKQLGNLLPRLAPSRSAAVEWADRAGWPSGWAQMRPEELPSEAYFALARAARP